MPRRDKAVESSASRASRGESYLERGASSEVRSPRPQSTGPLRIGRDTRPGVTLLYRMAGRALSADRGVRRADREQIDLKHGVIFRGI